MDNLVGLVGQRFVVFQPSPTFPRNFTVVAERPMLVRIQNNRETYDVSRIAFEAHYGVSFRLGIES